MDSTGYICLLGPDTIDREQRHPQISHLFQQAVQSGVVVQIAAVVVLDVESTSPDGNITTANDAVWWVFVTLTTVGYGDFFPTTMTGRIAAVFVMLASVAPIGVLASYLSNFFLEPPEKKDTAYEPSDPRFKLGELKSLLAQQQIAQQELEGKIRELEEIL